MTQEEEVDKAEADASRTVTMESYLSTAPTWLVQLLTTRVSFHQIAWEHDSDDLPKDIPSDQRKLVNFFAESEVVSSLNKTSLGDPPGEEAHALILDVDINCALIPSSTSGHSHLIFNHSVDTEGLHEILDVLAKHGVIEQNYAAVSKARPEGAFLRLPWIRKGMEKWDALNAFTWWVDSDDRALRNVGL